MRKVVLASVMMVAMAGAAHAESSGVDHRRLFISPMGEPFRAESNPQDIWFNNADTNHDGALSEAEFKADAMRFFAILDRKHDGEIDPDDIDHYETVLVPEIRVESSYLNTAESNGSATEANASDETPHIPYPDRQGAARFSYFDYPEPVIIADTNLNRGVDAREWQKAASDRFAMLDTNHDGVIKQDELPKLVSPAMHSGEGGKGGRGGKGRHHRGG
jgi:Ca2+-binding EF-hand superfamily protein